MAWNRTVSSIRFEGGKKSRNLHECLKSPDCVEKLQNSEIVIFLQNLKFGENRMGLFVKR
jgi:hypothetical protein